MADESLGTVLDVNLDRQFDELDPTVMGGTIVSMDLVKGQTNDGKSLIIMNITFDDGTQARGWTTLALFYAATRAFTPQWEIEVLQ